jgi:hypothetical protein
MESGEMFFYWKEGLPESSFHNPLIYLALIQEINMWIIYLDIKKQIVLKYNYT